MTGTSTASRPNSLPARLKRKYEAPMALMRKASLGALTPAQGPVRHPLEQERHQASRQGAADDAHEGEADLAEPCGWRLPTMASRMK